MPLGFRWNSPPDNTLDCDLPNCSVTGSSPVKLLACGHSFHTSCVKKDGNLLPCHQCWPNLKKEVTNLANSWNRGLQKPQVTSANPQLNENATCTTTHPSHDEDDPPGAAALTTQKDFYNSPTFCDSLKEKIDTFIDPNTIKYASAKVRIKNF